MAAWESRLCVCVYVTRARVCDKIKAKRNKWNSFFSWSTLCSPEHYRQKHNCRKKKCRERGQGAKRVPLPHKFISIFVAGPFFVTVMHANITMAGHSLHKHIYFTTDNVSFQSKLVFLYCHQCPGLQPHFSTIVYSRRTAVLLNSQNHPWDVTGF